jgi:hypothetical protein
MLAGNDGQEDTEMTRLRQRAPSEEEVMNPDAAT